MVADADVGFTWSEEVDSLHAHTWLGVVDELRFHPRGGSEVTELHRSAFW
jgi:hypothetical protein